MILSSINKQASNAHTQTQLPALPYNLIVPEPSSVSRTINRTGTPVPLSPAGLCSFHYTVQAALQVATVPAPNPPTPDPHHLSPIGKKNHKQDAFDIAVVSR